MDTFNIPKDIGGTWRRDKFIDYMLKSNSADTAMLDAYSKLKHLNTEQRIWLSYLHSCTNAEVTAVLLFNDLDYKEVSPTFLKKYWEENRSKLLFITDRIYVKNMNWFRSLIASFMINTNRQPKNILALAGQGTPYERYKTLRKQIMTWKYMGDYSTELFLEGLISVAKLGLKNNEFSWSKGRTMTSGMLHILYLDEEAVEFDRSGHLPSFLIPILEEELKDLVSEIYRQTGKYYDRAQVTPKLCSWRKLFKQSRYGEYYIDRQLDNLTQLRRQYPEKEEMWLDVLYARQEAFPRELRGELQGRTGVQKNRYKDWTDKGLTGVETIGKH